MRYLNEQFPIERLIVSPLWQNLLADAELQPEIRGPENSAISIYYRGRAIIRNMIVNDHGMVQASIHRKFIPITDPAGGKYFTWEGSITEGLCFQNNIAPIDMGLANQAVLNQYKERIRSTQSRPESKLVQSLFTDHRNQIIDQEIAFNNLALVDDDDNRRDDRIDVCNFDLGLNAISFIEVKRVGDPRLILQGTDDQPLVIQQLNSYQFAIHQFRHQIVEGYSQLVVQKQQLGLVRSVGQIPGQAIHQIVAKPVLVIGGCTAEDTREILDGEGRWHALREQVEACASALILFGNNGCNLTVCNGRQRVVFDASILNLH